MFEGLLLLLPSPFVYPRAGHLHCTDYLPFVNDEFCIYFVLLHVSVLDCGEEWDVTKRLSLRRLVFCFGATGKYHGGVGSGSLSSLSISKNRTCKTALCLARYLFQARMGHPANTCGRLSGTLPQSQQQLSISVVRVLNKE